MGNTLHTDGRLPAGPAPKSGFYYGYIIVLISFITMVLSWGVYYVYGVFFTPLTNEFGWSRAVTSGAFSASVLVAGTFGIVAGRISDRLGPGRVITVCALILAVAYFLLALVNSAWQFYLIYILLMSAGHAGFWAPLVSNVSRWFIRKRGIMTAIVSGGISFGTLVLPPVFTQMIGSLSWRKTYFIIGLVILVVVLISARFFRKTPASIAEIPDAPRGDYTGPVIALPVFSLKEAMATRQFWLVSAMYVCFGVIQLTIMVHIVPYATGTGISDMKASIILSLIGIVSFIGRMVIGLVLNRFKARLAAGFCLAILTASLILLLFSPGLWQLYLFAVGFGFGYGGLSCLQSLIAAELYGLMAIGVITGIYSFAFVIGGGVGPALAGFIYDVSLSYQGAFILCLSLAFIGLLLSFGFTPPQKK